MAGQQQAAASNPPKKNTHGGRRNPPGGRPKSFSMPIAEALLNASRTGAYASIACEFVGITKQCLHDWLKDGRRYLEKARILATKEIKATPMPDPPVGNSKRAQAQRAIIHAISERHKKLEAEPWITLPVREERELAWLADQWPKARAQAIVMHLANISNAAKRDGRLALEFIARVKPQMYGRRRLEISGPNGGPIESESKVRFYLPSNGREITPAEPTADATAYEGEDDWDEDEG